MTHAVFERRGIDLARLPSADAELLPLDMAVEERRHALVMHNFGAVAPGLVQLTSDVLFQDLWRRPGLTPRDRSLVTVCSVVATAQTAQLAFYLNRAMDNDLTRAEISEVMTQLAFYSGWSSVYTALAIVKDVFEARRTVP
jgi:4-carboxymuconolactone decarboxylase